MSVSEEYVKTLRKNGDVKTARRYEEGLYNSLGAIDFDVLDNLLAEVKRLRNGGRNILSDYDITDLIREVDEDDWNFEQQALVRMKELIE